MKYEFDPEPIKINSACRACAWCSKSVAMGITTGETNRS